MAEQDSAIDGVPTVDPDELVSTEYFPRRSPIELDVRLKDDSPLRIDPAEIEDLEYPIPVKVQQDLRKVSQLGLKEAWLGRMKSGEETRHERWVHSIGAFNASFIWLKVLLDDARVPRHQLTRPPLDGWTDHDRKDIKALVGTALLLHDYGHLPFAHLFNEALESINWIPTEAIEGSETVVLKKRLTRPALTSSFRSLYNRWLNASRHLSGSADVRDAVEALILGTFGVPWLQVIVNSAIDADKIHYLSFDSEYLRDSDYPVRTRLQETQPQQWLTEFLSEQEVNQAGLLALHGRSARAAADLWRERIFLYDRFYLSPELRVPERMALELVQQYLIRSVMSIPFLEEKTRFGNGVSALAQRLSVYGSDGPFTESIAGKFDAAVEVMEALLPLAGRTTREFAVLQEMKNALVNHEGMESDVRALLDRCFSCLTDLKEGKSWRQVMRESLVREPLIFTRDDFQKAKDVLREIQHRYAHEALIDIVQLPRVLAAPRRYHTGFRRTDIAGVDYQILVPDGPASTWGPGHRAKRPLTDECVEEIERPYARVIVVSPGEADSARAAYIWDRVRSMILDAGIQLLRPKENPG